MFDVKRLNNNARVPAKGSEEAAGYDLYSDEHAEVSHGKITKVGTGIAVKIPKGYVGLIKPRSGLAAKHGVDTMAGVIDSDYRGEIHVLLTCHDSEPGSGLNIKPGERIAQLLIAPVCNDFEPNEVSDFDDETQRGSNGFGSTGYK